MPDARRRISSEASCLILCYRAQNVTAAGLLENSEGISCLLANEWYNPKSLAPGVKGAGINLADVQKSDTDLLLTMMAPETRDGWRERWWGVLDGWVNERVIKIMLSQNYHSQVSWEETMITMDRRGFDTSWSYWNAPDSMDGMLMTNQGMEGWK